VITGFNTDVDHEGRVFHVQTEDKGLENPVVESLIYCGGEIVSSRQKPYERPADTDEAAEREIQRLMESQHQEMIRDIHNGKYDKEAPKPFGSNIITNRSLDEVVLEFLHSRDREETIRLELIDEQVIQEGTRPTVRLKVFEEETQIPVPAAEVHVRLISTEGQPQELFSASSDEEGFLEASFEVPSLPGADTALILSAEAGGQRAELRQLVVKGRAGSTP
jgi:hypothetical protein